MIIKYLVKLCQNQTFCLHWVAWMCIYCWTLSYWYTLWCWKISCHQYIIILQKLEVFTYWKARVVKLFKSHIFEISSSRVINRSSNFSDQTFFDIFFFIMLCPMTVTLWVTRVTFIIENKTSIFTLDPKLWSRQSLASGL